MSDMDETLKKSPRSPDEAAAGKLTQAARDLGAPPVHDAVGERIWRGVDAGLQMPTVVKRPRWHIASAAASALVVIVSVAFAVLRNDDHPRLIGGTAFVLDGGKTLRMNDPPLAWESRVVAGPDGSTFEA